MLPTVGGQIPMGPNVAVAFVAGETMGIEFDDCFVLTDAGLALGIGPITVEGA